MTTPEGSVKTWLKRQLDLRLPGHWRIMPRGGPFGKAGTGDIVLVYKGVPAMIEVKSDQGEATPLQMNSLRQFQAAGGVAALIKGKDEDRLAHIIAEIQCRVKP